MFYILGKLQLSKDSDTESLFSLYQYYLLCDIVVYIVFTTIIAIAYCSIFYASKLYYFYHLGTYNEVFLVRSFLYLDLFIF